LLGSYSAPYRLLLRRLLPH